MHCCSLVGLLAGWPASVVFHRSVLLAGASAGVFALWGVACLALRSGLCMLGFAGWALHAGLSVPGFVCWILSFLFYVLHFACFALGVGFSQGTRKPMTQCMLSNHGGHGNQREPSGPHQ